MRDRIFHSMVLLCALAILSTGVGLGIFFTQESNEAMMQEVRSEAICMAVAIETVSQDVAIDYLQRVSSLQTATRITLIAQDGTVLFDNAIFDATEMDNHNERPEVQAAQLHGSGEDIRSSDTLGQRTFYYAMQMDNGNILRTALVTDAFWYNLINNIPYMIVMGLVILVVAMFVSNRQTQNIVKPINAINLDHPLKAAGRVYDELHPFLQRIDQQNYLIREQMHELEEKQQEFATLTDNMSEGLVIINDQGYILSINKRALRIFGLQEDETYKNKHILMANRNVELKQMIDEALLGKNLDMLLELDGRTYQVMANPITVSGQTQGLVLLLLDITEKRHQDMLRREFTANVSHELRTPLTAISGFAEIMMHGLVPAENMQPFAEKIYKEANRLITLIADIIQLSRLDEGSAQFAWEQVDLSQLAEEVVQRLQPLAQQKDVTLSLYTEPTMAAGIRQVLQEILYNLCENAIKYNKTNGTVRLSVLQANGQAIIKVVDTGIGIATEDQLRVFERFYRVDKSHSRVIGGTGLGLSIVKHGVQLHNGVVEMESKLGQGTAITVRVPLTQPE